MNYCRYLYDVRTCIIIEVNLYLIMTKRLIICCLLVIELKVVLKICLLVNIVGY